VTSTRSASLDQAAVGGRSRATRSAVGWVREGLAAWLPALPLLLLAGALLVAPTVQLIVQSLRGSTGH
jgi:hypothetical protein